MTTTNHVAQFRGSICAYLGTPPGGWPETQEAWHTVQELAPSAWDDDRLREHVNQLAREHPDWLHVDRQPPPELTREQLQQALDSARTKAEIVRASRALRAHLRDRIPPQTF